MLGSVSENHPGPIDVQTNGVTCQAVTEPAKAAKIAKLRDRLSEINVLRFVTFVTFFLLLKGVRFVTFYYFFITCNFHKLFFTGQGNYSIHGATGELEKVHLDFIFLFDFFNC
jgi:hypothetical protein